MNIIAIINGKKKKLDIPTGWKDITFRKFVDLYGVDSEDKITILSRLIGIDRDVLLKSKIKNFDLVLRALNFLKYPMMQSLPNTIIGRKIPKDLNIEEAGRFEDMRLIISKLKEDTPLDNIKKFPEIVAIYVMPNYIDSTDAEKEHFANKIWDAPCEEVVAIANFTLVKQAASSTNINPSLFLSTTPLRRLMLALTIFLVRLRFSFRFALWNARHRSPATRYSSGPSVNSTQS